MTALPIAEAPDELTATWLTAVLSAHGVLGDAAVSTASLEPLGTGQMCDSWRVTLTYDRTTNAPATLVAKLPAADPTSRATALALRSYENEVRFYQQLAPGLPLHTPALYYADIDVTTAAFVLLLEDMAPARPGDQLTGCSVSEAELAVGALVGLHAPRWADPALDELEWLHRDPAAGRAFLEMTVPGFWDGFCTRYADRLTPEIHSAGDALLRGLHRYLESNLAPWTIVHGDYRLDNLLFEAGPGRAALTVVDWQTCTHGPAMQDVAYFIGAGLLPDARRAHEVRLVHRYHDALCAAGVTDYDWDRCWEDYRRATFSGLIMAIAASMLVERTERGDEMFLTMAERHARHALDLDAPALIGC